MGIRRGSRRKKKYLVFPGKVISKEVKKKKNYPAINFTLFYWRNWRKLFLFFILVYFEEKISGVDSDEIINIYIYFFLESDFSELSCG